MEALGPIDKLIERIEELEKMVKQTKTVLGFDEACKYIGCLLYTSNAKSISFPGVASTMMACPDMETEGKVLKAINEVKSFDVLSGGGIGSVSYTHL